VVLLLPSWARLPSQLRVCFSLKPGIGKRSTSLWGQDSVENWEELKWLHRTHPPSVLGASLDVNRFLVSGWWGHGH
jgi:hypothetical protein